VTTCLSELPLPPEAFDLELTDTYPHTTNDEWSRMLQTEDDEVVWNPDSVSQQRLIAEESLPLEQRGLTSHLPRLSNNGTVKLSQAEFWKLQSCHKFTVASKLRMAGLEEDALCLENCHSYYTVATCGDCGKVRKFPNRCDRFYCPECANHLQHERQKQIQWWAERITQPKHVVLTIKNVKKLTPGHVDELRRMFSKLRRRKFARNWIGGYYGIQVTTGKQGWHLHIHALVDARWISEAELSQEWKACTNGYGYIVKVKDCRKSDYLRETTRYVIHGSQIAAWSPATIASFVSAFKGKRTFGVFGKLYGQRVEFAEWIASLKQVKPRCDCGSCNVRYQTESDWMISQAAGPHSYAPRPPPGNSQQLLSSIVPPQWPD
jgi:hypothetical protein